MDISCNGINSNPVYPSGQVFLEKHQPYTPKSVANSNNLCDLDKTSLPKRTLSVVDVEPVVDVIPISNQVVFKSIVYIWIAKKDDFDPELHETPIYNYRGAQFLQNAIAHAKNYNVKIVFFDKNIDPLKQQQVSKSFRDLEKKLNKERIDIQLIDANILFTENRLKLEMLTNENTGVSVDLLKMFVGSNLGCLNLNKALIADFDTELPDELVIDMCEFTTIPMIDTTEKISFWDDDLVGHFIENGFSFVCGSHNQCYQSMLDELQVKLKTKNSLTLFDVYQCYVVKSLIEITGEDCNISSQEIISKYYKIEYIDEKIISIFKKNTISFERGDTWRPELSRRASMPINFQSQLKPVYERELEVLRKKILFYKGDFKGVIDQIGLIIKKGGNINDINFAYVNFLRRQKGNVIEYVLDRFKDEYEGTEEVFEYLLENGAVFSPEGLKFIDRYDKTLKHGSVNITTLNILMGML